MRANDSLMQRDSAAATLSATAHQSRVCVDKLVSVCSVCPQVREGGGREDAVELN